MTRLKKNAFLIVRVTQADKTALLADAKKNKLVLSALLRKIVADYLNGR